MTILYSNIMPVDMAARITHTVEWYATENEAETMGAYYRKAGLKYNGGLHHGKLCGREPGRDKRDETGRKVYAVTR